MRILGNPTGGYTLIRLLSGCILPFPTNLSPNTEQYEGINNQQAQHSFVLAMHTGRMNPSDPGFRL